MALILLGLGVPAVRAASPEASVSEKVPNTESTSESEPTGQFGSIVFFPNTESRPSDERFEVEAGQEVPVCVKLSGQASVYVDKLASKTIGYLLILEDNSDPPQRLAMTIGNRLHRLKPNAEGCFQGTWRLPETVKTGIYQVSDLLWAASDESFYSLRNYLYEFSRVEELQVTNPKSDANAPQLKRIVTYKKPPYRAQYYAGVLRIRFEQGFEFEDAESSVDKDSLSVFYRVEVDGTTVDVLESKCKKIPQTHRFRCLLDVANPEILWGLNKVTLNLESIAISDEAGNRLQLKGAEEIQAQVPDAVVKAEFIRAKKWPSRPDLDLKKDPNIPPSTNF